MNSAALLQDGKIAFLQSKMLLPTYDVFDEMRNFAPATRQHLFPFCGKQMALTICEDAWNDKHFWNNRLYTFDPVEAFVKSGGRFVLNISASPFWLGKREFRREMLASIARTQKFRWPWSIRWAATTAWCSTAPALCLILPAKSSLKANRSRKTSSTSILTASPAKCIRKSKERRPASMLLWYWARGIM